MRFCRSGINANAWLAAALLCMMVTVCKPLVSAEQRPQSLTLTVQLDTVEFFEGQPVFYTVQLTNVGPDTAWIPPFHVLTGDIQLILVRSDGAAIPKREMIVDELVTGPWRGLPLAPGARLYELGDLQLIWGTDGPLNKTVFELNLLPGHYELRASFNPSASPEELMPLVTAAPVVFDVRTRTPTENADYQQVVQLAEMLRQSSQRDAFIGAMIAWAEPRIGSNGVNPFAAFLVTNGLYVGGGAGLVAGLDVQDRVKTIQAIGASTKPDRPIGALLAAEAVKTAQRNANDNWIPGFVQALGTSLAGAVARQYALPQGQP